MFLCVYRREKINLESSLSQNWILFRDSKYQVLLPVKANDIATPIFSA